MTKKQCKDCENFGGRVIFQYDGHSRVICLENLLKGVYPHDSICSHFIPYTNSKWYYKNDYLRRIITDILWRIGRRKNRCDVE